MIERLTSAQWLNGFSGKKKQSKEMEDWHQCNGSTALAAKSNNQKGWKIGIGAMAQQPQRQKSNNKKR
jgi:hypothetical protein